MEEKEIVERVVKLETKSKQYEKDIDDLKDTQRMIYEMNGNIRSIVEKIGNTNDEIVELKCDMKKDIGSLRNDIEEVKTKTYKKDAQKWDKLMWLIAGAIITLLSGMVKSALGL